MLPLILEATISTFIDSDSFPFRDLSVSLSLSTKVWGKETTILHGR
jgi:hypothetical protein